MLLELFSSLKSVVVNVKFKSLTPQVHFDHPTGSTPKVGNRGQAVI
jgi:hypothetical protein